LGARLETDLAPRWDRLFDQLADGFENLLSVGIMALVLLFDFVKLLGELPVCARRLPDWQPIAGFHYFVLLIGGLVCHGNIWRAVDFAAYGV
jgi:hypothetical protein